MIRVYWSVFFFNDTATTEIYTLSLHDALPIFHELVHVLGVYEYGHRGDVGELVVEDRLALHHRHRGDGPDVAQPQHPSPDRKSTRLNSSHANISYAVFCLKKKKNNKSTVHSIA